MSKNGKKLITFNIIPAQIDFYLLTKEQIKAFAELGHFFNYVIIPLISICAGGALALWVAQQQSSNNKVLFEKFGNLLVSFLVLLGCLFLIGLCVFILQWRRKADLFSTKIDLEDKSEKETEKV